MDEQLTHGSVANGVEGGYEDGGVAGDLIYFPKAREAPKSEIGNFIGKISHKRFVSKKGIEGGGGGGSYSSTGGSSYSSGNDTGYSFDNNIVLSGRDMIITQRREKAFGR